MEKFIKRARSSRALSHWANSFPFYLTVPKTRESSNRTFLTDTRNHIYRFVSNNARAENVDLFGANLLLVLFATETAPPRKSVSWKYFGMKMMKIWERYQMRELWVFSERAFRLLISNRAHEPLGYKMFALQINSFSQNWGKQFNWCHTLFKTSPKLKQALKSQQITIWPRTDFAMINILLELLFIQLKWKFLSVAAKTEGLKTHSLAFSVTPDFNDSDTFRSNPSFVKFWPKRINAFLFASCCPS